MLVKKQEDLNLYKRIHEKGEINCDYNFEITNKPFSSVEIEQNNNRVAIHDKLKGFYIKGNMLLDKVFLKWYLEEFYSMILDDNYKIHIIYYIVLVYIKWEKQKENLVLGIYL